MAGIFGPTSPADEFVIDSFGVRGPAGPAPLAPIVPWAAGVDYTAGPPASWVSRGGASYACTAAHRSGVWALDLAAGLWCAVAGALTSDQLLALPRAPDGLEPGDLWVDGGIVTVVIDDAGAAAPGSTPSGPTAPPYLTAPSLVALLTGLPTAKPDAAGQLYWDQGVLSLS